MPKEIRITPSMKEPSVPKEPQVIKLRSTKIALKKVRYRAPYSNAWKEVSWEWALDKIAANIKKSRDESFMVNNADGKAGQPNQWNCFGWKRGPGQRGMLALPEVSEVSGLDLH